jgi:hypothetical protein
MSSKTVQPALKLAAAAVMGVGAVVALAAFPPTALVTNVLSDLVFWPFDGRQAVDTQTARLLAAIGGGVMFGWGLLLWQIASQLLPKEPALAASLIRTSVIAWFALDCTCSVLAGAYLNVVLNMGFLAMFLVPLMSLDRGAAVAMR